MKSKNLAEYATDTQEKEQLRLKSTTRKPKPRGSMSGGVNPSPPSFETTGGKSPLALNKRKGKTY